MDSDISSLAYNQSYNPNDGLLSFTSIYGNDTVVTFDYIQNLVNRKIAEGIVFGTRCGAATLTLVIMWMISKSWKTPVFIMNQISLSLIIIHSGLYFRSILSGYASIAYVLTGFPQLISPSDLHSYAACNIIQVLLVASIETSLIFQVRVIFADDKSRRFGLIFTTMAAALGLATIGMYFYSAIRPIITLYDESAENYPTYFNVALILLASSINFTTFLLVIKLIFAVRSRRFLGLKQFDSFHILLIICFQTLLVPSLLFILAYSLPENKNTDFLIPIATLMVVLSLPLSSMWATAASNVFKPSLSSGFSPSSCGFSSGSDSLQSSTKRGLREKIYDLYPRHATDGDKNSERTYCERGDLEKNGPHELSTPITHDISDDYSSAKTPQNSRYRANTYDQQSWSTKIAESTCGTTPVKKLFDNNSKDVPLDLICGYDNKDEGFVEMKKITLKK